MDEIVKIQNQNFKHEAEYMKDFESNQLPITIHYHLYENEGEKTKYGNVVVVTNVKKGDFISMYQQPCYIISINSSNKGIWIIGRCIYNHLECDIVFKPSDLVEKINYRLITGIIIEVINAYATVVLDDDNEKEVKVPMPSSEIERKMFEEINSMMLKQEKIKVELIEICDKICITKLI